MSKTAKRISDLRQLAKIHGYLIGAIDKHSVSTFADDALYHYIPKDKLMKIAKDLLAKTEGLSS